MSIHSATRDGHAPSRPSVWGDEGLLGRMMTAGSQRYVTVLKQSVVFVLVLLAAALSSVVPWLLVTDAASMWAGAAAAFFGTVVAALTSWRPRLLRWEIVIPAADFVAVGLLRYGTGDSRSIFLPIILLAIVWIAVWPGRINILWLLIGSSVTLLLPFLFDPTGREPSEIIRLLFALTVYSIVGLAINELARQARQKLDRSRAEKSIVDREIDRAATVQQSLLPPATSDLPDEFRVVGACVPARTVGGDFYDWYSTPDGIALTVGDVMGKGVGAGMIAAAVRSVIRSSVDDADPATAFRRATVGLATGDDATDVQFTTCFHARIDARGSIRWADAGHGLALVRRSDGHVDHLQSDDLPVGVGTGWTAQVTQLYPGDTVVCVSDGVLDLFDDELGALDQVKAMLSRTEAPADLVRSISRLAAAEDRPDDVTIVAVSFAPSLVTA